MALNLANIEKLDLSTDEGQRNLAGMVDSAFTNIHPYVMSLAKTWDTNIRFYEGDQWIYYDETLQRNIQIPIIDGKTDFIPRPVTNLIPSALWTIASIFTKNKPSALVFANSENAEDIMAARVAEAIADTKWELDGEQLKHVDAILIALLCGVVFRKDYWDPGKQETFIQTPQGTEKVALGDTSTDMLSPFEVYPDIYGGQYFLQASVTPINEIEMLYGYEGNGFTGLVDKIKKSKAYSSVLQIRENLRTHTRSYFGTSGSQGEDADQDTAVLVEAYIKPCKAYPAGLMVVEAGGVPLYVNHSPYWDPKVEDSWHPYTIFKWLKSPTRWHPMSLVEQIVPLQRRINGIDSIIQLHNMTMINPIWLNPKSCQIPKGYFNGRPGLVVDYVDSPGNPPPQRIPGVPLGNDIYQEREQKVADLHQIVGDNLVMQGEQPSGVNTATGLQLLLEQSSTKFSPFYSGWEKFIEQGQQKKLLLISKFYSQNRPDFVNKLKKYSKNANNIEIESFVGADLRDNLNIRIEAGSSIPRSKLVEQQQLRDLAKEGALGDVSPANPVANAEYLQKFGVTQFSGVSNPDLVKANFVVGVLNQINDGKIAPDNYPPLLPFENVDIHMATLVDEMKRPEFKDRRGVFKQKFDELLAAKEEQNKLAAQAAISSPAPGGAPPVGAPLPQDAPPPGAPLPIDQPPQF